MISEGEAAGCNFPLNYTPEEKDLQRGIFDTANIFKTAKKINSLMKFIGCQIIGREEIIRQSFYALLTGEHQLLFSRTGMAKSLLARQVFSCFDRAVVFEKQLTKDTMPDNLFGAYDIVQLKRGRLVHNIENSIVLSDFAFLDEIFDANDMLLRSLLSLLNEKRLINGEQQISSPLNTVIAAANYLRITDVLEAVLDRFLYKSYIPENKDLYLQTAIDLVYQENHGRVVDPEVKIDLDEFFAIRGVINSQSIVIPEYILFLKNYIVRRYIEEVRATDVEKSDFMISDRTSVKIQNLLRTSAMLDCRCTVEEKDLNQMYYLICMLGKEEEKDRLLAIVDFARKYFGSDSEILEDVLQLMRAVQEMKRSSGNQKAVKPFTMIQAMEKVENTLREKGGFRQKLHTITQRVI
ncbi:MAG: AAA family ATPase, partial [bacterium]